MTPADIERMAREAGMEQDGCNWFSPSPDPLDTFDVSTGYLARFATLVAAAERERCAKVCEAYTDPADGKDAARDTRFVADACATAIRALEP